MLDIHTPVLFCEFSATKRSGVSRAMLSQLAKSDVQAVSNKATTSAKSRSISSGMNSKVNMVR
jgi:hypothetical protein